MTWLVIALIGYALLALTFILDKYILSSTTIARPSVYAFYSTIILWPALLLLLVFPEAFSLMHIGISLLSGVAFGLGLLTLYIALKGTEASHVTPLNGVVVIFTTYVLSYTFLAEQLSRAQFFGILLFSIASIVLSYQETRGKSGYSTVYWWAVISGIFFGVSHVTAKYIYMFHEFIPAFAWTRAGAGIVGLALLLYPPVWHELRLRFTVRKKTKKKAHTKLTSLVLVWVTKLCGVLAVVAIQYAAALGSVSVVQAMSGLQYALMFIGVYVLSTWFPRVFREYFTRREIIMQSIGIILVIIGSLFFV